MKSNFEVCDVCGTKLVPFIEGDCCGSMCPKCKEKKTVTSYIGILSNDNTTYKISLVDNEVNIQNIKALSKILNCNYIVSKNFLENNKLIIEGKAIDIYEQINDLDLAYISYEITPNYPYKIKKY